MSALYHMGRSCAEAFLDFVHHTGELRRNLRQNSKALKDLHTQHDEITHVHIQLHRPKFYFFRIGILSYTKHPTALI